MELKQLFKFVSTELEKKDIEYMLSHLVQASRLDGYLTINTQTRGMFNQS